MRISVGAANAAVAGSAAAIKLTASRERRDTKRMQPSKQGATRRDDGRAADVEAGFLPALSVATGGPGALAAFVKRPQAASSNRRYVCSIEAGFPAVKEQKSC